VMINSSHLRNRHRDGVFIRMRYHPQSTLSGGCRGPGALHHRCIHRPLYWALGMSLGVWDHVDPLSPVQGMLRRCHNSVHDGTNHHIPTIHAVEWSVEVYPSRAQRVHDGYNHHIPTIHAVEWSWRCAAMHCTTCP